jgi:hypothetical protein
MQPVQSQQPSVLLTLTQKRPGHVLSGVMTPCYLTVMTPGRKIKVRLTVTVEVDVDEWMAEFGCERDEIRADVRDYFANQVGQAPAIEDAGLTVRVA